MAAAAAGIERPGALALTRSFHWAIESASRNPGPAETSTKPVAAAGTSPRVIRWARAR